MSFGIAHVAVGLACGAVGFGVVQYLRTRRRPSPGTHVLVTGANKGIGLAIVKGLVQAGVPVLLGSRDYERGIAAKKSLGREFAHLVTVLQLDVSSDELSLIHI